MVVHDNYMDMHDAVSEYLVAVSRLQAAQLRVSRVFEVIVPLHTDDEDAKDISEEWASRTSKNYDWYKEVLEPTHVETLIRPLGEKLARVPELKNKISVRESKILDYDAYRSRMNAETAKNPDSEAALKLQTKLEKSRENMNTATEEVMGLCRQIESNNSSVITKVFSNLIACQALMNDRQAEHFMPLLEGLPRSAEAMVAVCNNPKSKDRDKMYIPDGTAGADGVKRATRESLVLMD